MICITGLGAVSALGVGVEVLERVLSDPPPDGIRPVDHIDMSGFTTRLGAIVPGWRGKEPAVDYARVAMAEARAQARLDTVDPARIAVVLGGSLGTGRERLYELADDLARLACGRGPCVTVSTACSSSSTAVGYARDLLRTGSADVAIAGGTDVLSKELFAGFHAIGALSPAACAPFSAPAGTTLGEGAGFLVLESAAHAANRGAVPLAWILGYGLSADAYHPTSPDPTGSGIARAIRSALVDAGLEAKDVGYINAHGTGTEANDPAETRGIAAALGGLALPISASKSFLGHAQGAAGALELIVTILGLRAQRLPPTLHVSELRRSAPRDVVPTPRAHTYEVALSLNAAFGGANSALLVGRSPRTAPPARVSANTSRRPRIASAAVLVGDIDQLDALDAAITRGHRVLARVASAPVERLLPMADTRGMDPSTRFVSTVVARALGGPLRGERRERTGIVTAVSGASTVSSQELQKSIDERGLSKLNATAFSKMVLNAGTGVAATLLSLRGASTTLTVGRGGGLVAIAYAAELLAHRSGTDSIVACSVDEAGDAEGAAAMVLGNDGPVELAGWAVHRRGSPTVAEVALERAGTGSPEIVLTDDPEPAKGATSLASILGPITSAGSMIACAHAFALLREGRVRSVLVTTQGGGVSAALVFVGGSQE